MRVQESKEFLHVPAGSTNTSLPFTGLSTVRTHFYITPAPLLYHTCATSISHLRHPPKKPVFFAPLNKIFMLMPHASDITS